MFDRREKSGLKYVWNNQVILAGTLTGVQGGIRCKDLADLSTV